MTRLLRFSARDYDPVTARWNSGDPLGFGGGTPSLYVYSMHDQINMHDPTGLRNSHRLSSRYSSCSTQVELENVYQNARSSFGMLRIVSAHQRRGRFDYCARENESTFVAGGVTLNACEFGNLAAGFAAGVANPTVAGRPVGYPLVRVAGWLYDATDAARSAIFANESQYFDFDGDMDSVPFIDYGWGLAAAPMCYSCPSVDPPSVLQCGVPMGTGP